VKRPKINLRRPLAVGAVIAATGAGMLAIAPSASATSNTVSVSYTCYTSYGSYSNTEDITVTAPATAHVGDNVTVTVSIPAPGLNSVYNGTASGSMDFVYGNGWLDAGTFRLYSPTYTLVNGGAVPSTTVTGTLHVTTVGTYGIGPVGGNIAARPNGGSEVDAGCTLTTGSSSAATIVVS